MRKPLLLLAGAMLSMFSIKAYAQTAEETLFFFGFEDGAASLVDSTAPIDSVTQINYYDGPSGNGTNVMPTSFDVVYTKDTLLLLYNGITPYETRDDSYEIVEDQLGSHEADLQELGAQGGKYYLKYISGGDGSTLCDDYRANLFIRGIELEEQTSYRLVFYSKASDPEANLQAGIYRGYYSCEKPISLNGGGSNQFLINKTEFTTDRWERNTLMLFYQNDSVANTNMYNNGYWWSSTWKAVDPETGNEYDKIQQFDKYYLRLSFRYPGRTYYIDDISLYKSTIGGAEFNGDILRVNFGYETNLAQLAMKDASGSLELPGEYFSISAEYAGDPYELDVLAAEYHSDGYLYIWLDDDSFEGLENVRLSFTNPEDPTLQLKYTGALYPNSLDTAWVNAGKIVPDFENEFAVYNPEVTAISKVFLAPVMVNSIPENGSFNLDQATRSIGIQFSKDIYVNTTGGSSDEYNPLLTLQTSTGREIWTPTDYDADNYIVTFTRPASATGNLSGDLDFQVLNARADKGDMYQVSDPVTVSLSFGDVAQLGEPNFIYESEVQWASDASRSIPKGWISRDSGHGEDGEVGTGEAPASSGSELIYFGAGGAFTRGYYICPRGNSGVDASFSYGEADDYVLTLDEGNYWLSFKAIGWSNQPTVYLYFYPLGEDRPDTPVAKFKPENIVDWQVANTGSYVVTEETEYRYDLTVESLGNYVIEFVILANDNWGWGATVMGSLVLSNQYSSAFKYIKMLTDAQAAAQAVLATAQAEDIYSGDYLNDYKSEIESYDGFTSTSPTDYENATQAIKDAMSVMNSRISTVDKFYAAFNAALDKKAVYVDSTYNQLAAYSELDAKIAEYDGLDVTVKDNDELASITAEITDATAAMTDRCSIMDNYTALKSGIETMLADNANYDFTTEYKNAQTAYNQNKDIDLIAATNDEITAANTALNDASTAFNNKLTAAGILTTRNKNLQALAEILEADLGSAKEDVDEAMATILEDRDDIADLYKLAIKAKISEIFAEGGNVGGELDMTPFIKNNGFYTTYSPNTSQLYNNEDPLPGWDVLKGSGNVYLRRVGSGTNRNLTYEGSASDAGIAADWYASIKMTQTVKNLPAGKYTITETCTDSGWGSVKYIEGGLIVIQKSDSGDTLAIDTLHGNAPEAIQFTALGGDVELLHDYTTTNTWAFIDNMQLTLNEPLEGYDYSSDVTSAKESLEELSLKVYDINEASEDVRYYNLNGIRTDKPSGISIRITTGKDGKQKTKKVFIR